MKEQFFVALTRFFGYELLHVKDGFSDSQGI